MIKLFEYFVAAESEKQLMDFNQEEDRVKSAFISKSLKQAWKTRLEKKYPLLAITFYENGDTRKAQATIKK